MENKLSGTRNSKTIKASSETLYKAFTDPEALAVWMAPETMTGKVHEFDLRVGGGYVMSLYYPSSDAEAKGKTSTGEDRYRARFLELSPFTKIVQAIHFDSEDPAFGGEMIMQVTFEAKNNGTKVTFLFTNIPAGINPEDNKEGTRSTLKNLASYVERKKN